MRWMLGQLPIRQHCWLLHGADACEHPLLQSQTGLHLTPSPSSDLAPCTRCDSTSFTVWRPCPSRHDARDGDASLSATSYARHGDVSLLTTSCDPSRPSDLARSDLFAPACDLATSQSRSSASRSRKTLRKTCVKRRQDLNLCYKF